MQWRKKVIGRNVVTTVSFGASVSEKFHHVAMSRAHMTGSENVDETQCCVKNRIAKRQFRWAETFEDSENDQEGATSCFL